MSEYQYYDFRAVDRPLTRADMTALRKITSRAEITPTSLTNTYEWGDFKGEPRKLMEKYFDAFVYVANWGTREFMLRLPRRAIEPKAVSPYCDGESLWMKASKTHVILGFNSDDDSGNWEGWMESESLMDWLLPLRQDLVGGDFRCLYLGWLAGQRGRESKTIQPPVPLRMNRPTEPLKAFASFLMLDPSNHVIGRKR